MTLIEVRQKDLGKLSVLLLLFSSVVMGQHLDLDVENEMMLENDVFRPVGVEQQRTFS